MIFIYWCLILAGCISSPIVKRGDDAVALKGFFADILGFKFHDFLSLNTQEQMSYLIALCQKHQWIAENIFIRLNNIQRNNILFETDQFQRFTLWTAFSTNARAILLSILDPAEVEMIASSQKLSYLNDLLDKCNDDQRGLIINHMGAKVQAKWLLELDPKKVPNVASVLNVNQKMELASEFFSIRLKKDELDSKTLSSLNDISFLLDQLSGSYTRDELDLLLHSGDPLIYFTIFTPKERDMLKSLMNLDDKKTLYGWWKVNNSPEYPQTFFSKISLKNLYNFSNQQDWLRFWNQMNHEISNQEHLHDVSHGGRRAIFPSFSHYKDTDI